MLMMDLDLSLFHYKVTASNLYIILKIYIHSPINSGGVIYSNETDKSNR